MTLKTSLFNKGIYKSTVKRYMWGSVLYFVLLFMITVLPIVFGVDLDDAVNYMSNNSMSLLYSSDLVVISCIISMFVPTVAGLLVFRFVHSKKASVFTHSIPVNRNSMYLSTIAGAFTLMFLPILLNGLILLLITANIYYNFISISSCLVWIAVNLVTIFLMFSCVCFVAMLTGNSFAMVGLNVLLHSVVALIVTVLNVVASSFLYGMSDSLTPLVREITKSNFVYEICDFAENVGRINLSNTYIISPLKITIYVLCAVLFYVAGWVLYKKRNLENAEDVAGFKCLNPIFKYLVTFLGTICVFALLSSVIAENPILFFAIVIILSCIIYFASEMILKKTLKVFKSYKGYIGFAVVFALMISVFAFTSFFGYEKYVPDTGEVEQVAIYRYYDNIEPYVKDGQVAECVAKIHKTLLADDKIYIVKSDKISDSKYTRLHFKYKMKDGDTVERVYYVSKNEYYEIMNELYSYNNYKYAVEMPLYYDTENIYKVTLGVGGSDDVELKSREEMVAFVECLRKDIEELDYSQINYSDYCRYSASVKWIYQGEGSYKYGDGEKEFSLISEGFNLTANFKHSRKWLEQNGYGEYISFESDSPCYIIYDDVDQYYNYTYEEFQNLSTILTEPVLFKDKYLRVEDAETKKKILQYFTDNYSVYYPDKKYFYVFNPTKYDGLEVIGLVEEDKAKEFAEYIFE